MNPKTLQTESEEFQNLMKMALRLNEELKNQPLSVLVEETYFNFGQGWKWTTLILRDLEETPPFREVQLINPRQWEDIILGKDIFQEILNSIPRYFSIPVFWEMQGELKVKAKTLKEAIEKTDNLIENNTFDIPDGETSYVDGSFTRNTNGSLEEDLAFYEIFQK